MPNRSIPAPLADFIRNSRLALCLATEEGTEHPLVAANHAFCKLTQYSPAEIIGRDCRFLQGDRTEKAVRPEFADFFARPSREHMRMVLLNYKKSGAPFVNQLFLSRIHAPNGRDQYFLGSQFDVTKRAPAEMLQHEKDLRTEVRSIGAVANDAGLLMDSSLQVLANSAALIAQARVRLGLPKEA